MLFQQIRSATVKVTCGGVTFLVDPMLAPKDFYPPFPKTERKWPMCDLPFAADEVIVGTDAVIMTHYHIDHFDEFAVKALNKDIKVFCQDEFDQNFLAGYGFTNTEILRAEGTEFKGVMLYKTECLHGVWETAAPYYEMIDLRPNAMGVVFKAPSAKTLYLAGDTIWYDGVKRALYTYKPDAAIVNAACAQIENYGHRRYYSPARIRAQCKNHRQPHGYCRSRYLKPRAISTVYR